MWTLWPTAPWCSGSSSAAGYILDKCAAEPARDTDLNTMDLTASIFVSCTQAHIHTYAVSLKLSHWALWQQPSHYLYQRSMRPTWDTVRQTPGPITVSEGPLFFPDAIQRRPDASPGRAELYIPLEGGLLKPGETEWGRVPFLRCLLG